MAAGDGDMRRAVPGTDTLLADPRLATAASVLGRTIVKDAINAAQEKARRGEITPEEVTDTAVAALPEGTTSLRRVINATGVVIHTNLGRAALSAAAVDALRTAAGYTDLEYDLVSGTRGRRGRGALLALAAAVPAAESVHVVNNGAAALVLAATALAAGREIVISRGELVEIGDGFRIPDLLSSTGASLREVGTTNRTVAADYADAIGPRTGFLLKVHPSNFIMDGFTSSVPVAELARLGPPVVVDIGSGLLRPDRLLTDEPDATTALRDGATIVTASGDKLLGGPQAGLILGSAPFVNRLRRHPLARALRADKLTLAALEATLRGPATPTGEALRRDANELRARAHRLCEAIREYGVHADAVETIGKVGGGGAPGVDLPSWALSLDPTLTAPLRTNDPPVVGRVAVGRLLLDLRCVSPADDETVLAAVKAASEAAKGAAAEAHRRAGT